MFIVPFSSLPPLEPMAETNNSEAQAGGQAGMFTSFLENAYRDLEEAQRVSEEDAMKVASGQIEDLAMMMIHSNEAAVALESTVQLTTRAVNAYKEIMQMQV